MVNAATLERKTQGFAAGHGRRSSATPYAVKFNERAKPGMRFSRLPHTLTQSPAFDIVSSFTFYSRSGTFVARDNIANFVFWARSIGVDDVVMFEPEDIVGNKSEKNVLYGYI